MSFGTTSVPVRSQRRWHWNFWHLVGFTRSGFVNKYGDDNRDEEPEQRMTLPRPTTTSRPAKRRALRQMAPRKTNLPTNPRKRVSRASFAQMTSSSATRSAAAEPATRDLVPRSRVLGIEGPVAQISRAQLGVSCVRPGTGLFPGAGPRAGAGPGLGLAIASQPKVSRVGSRVVPKVFPETMVVSDPERDCKVVKADVPKMKEHLMDGLFPKDGDKTIEKLTSPTE
ncbi:Uu.00g143700.m01.CDS01 [Anthostomella pinea]|uniref:Uu.00g143700.m01.CDS01 n=1 Tax=Anthostomella pinea TaxID=933095 RepID=A0AAI8VRI6_9PEZI|nr:Uu.00g143700.m01.CDS01 [Anthostomella pinea]